MQEYDCKKLLSEIKYDVDIRKLPDNFRRERFKLGWEDFTIRGKVYAENTLKRLTWQNLGYRMGNHFGGKLPDEIYCIYEQFSNHYQSVLAPVYKENSAESVFPEEICSSDEEYYEGATQKVTVNIYERNPEARQKCIEYYGTDCYVCSFNFEDNYGEIGKGFIHVHHLKPLSEIGEEYELNPLQDLRPVCPNCHAMLHKRKPPYSIEELKQIINP
ncbi:MAG: HNH endonuclease [Pseudomonadota bacterium]|nr:HNH endonuclease [Pseudomonadota bacterium]